MGLPQAFVELIFDLMDDIARIGNWFRKNPIAGLGVVFLIVFLGLFAQRWFAESAIFSAEFWERDPEGIRNLIWALATLFAGAAGLYGLLLAGRRTAALDRQAQVAHDHRVLAEQGQITERFTKAIEQLAHKEMSVRLGAIFALERIAHDSERDFLTTMETLAAFVRGERSLSLASENAHQAQDTQTPIDVSAAVKVLYRSIGKDSVLRSGRNVDRIDLRHVNLSGVDAAGADFSGFRLDGSSFRRATLQDCSFQNSDLFDCDFGGAHLSGANFEGVWLSGVSFRNAYLGIANFHNAHLYQVNFESANASGAVFDDAQVVESKFQKSRLLSTTFFDAQLWASDFSGAILDNAVFDGADVSEVNFEDASGMDDDQLGKAVFRPEKPPFKLPANVVLPSEREL